MNIITKTYESLLPFVVVEAISAHGDSFNSMSVRMIDKGWAWLVSGRKLFIWKFKESKSHNVTKARRMLNPCYELQLPQSDLAHKAELIQVFFMPQNPNVSLRAITVPAALVISPEGTIRFWSNVANERFTESQPVVDMQGQEFCTFASLSCLEYLLGTTTGSLYILNIDMTSHDSKNILVCSALNEPSGLLSGFGRRVTTLFFGQMATDVGSDTRRPLVAVPKYSQSTIDKIGSTDRPFFVMSSTFKLRQWSRTNEGSRSTNQLIREWDLQKNVYMKLASELGLPESGNNLNFWPIDMITTKSKELLILIVTLDALRDNAIYYATCLFNPYQAGDSLANVTVLRSHTWNYSNESEDQLLALRFLERRIKSPICFMYDRKFLFLVQIDQDILDAIDYGNQDDGILGAGMIENHPILFTQRDGLIYVVPVASNRSRMNETSIQLEPPIISSSNSLHQQSRREESQLHHSIASNRVDPMIVEVDVEEEEEQENNGRLSRANQSHRGVENDQSNLNTSTQTAANNSTAASAKRKDDASEILRENREFEWVRQIESREYGLASETLARLAVDSELLKDRKETLLALSQLARLAE